MSKARIAVIGAGLMGHGIAQVFALAGHDVTITDPQAASLATVKQRISANLADLGDDPKAVERVTPVAARWAVSKARPASPTSTSPTAAKVQPAPGSVASLRPIAPAPAFATAPCNCPASSP